LQFFQLLNCCCWRLLVVNKVFRSSQINTAGKFVYKRCSGIVTTKKVAISESKMQNNSLEHSLRCAIEFGKRSFTLGMRIDGFEF